MNSREGILAAIDQGRLDRMPTEMWSTAEVWQTLLDWFGPEDAIYQNLQIDVIATAFLEYIGPLLRVHEEEDRCLLRRWRDTMPACTSWLAPRILRCPSICIELNGDL